MENVEFAPPSLSTAQTSRTASASMDIPSTQESVCPRLELLSDQPLSPSLLDPAPMSMLSYSKINASASQDTT